MSGSDRSQRLSLASAGSKTRTIIVLGGGITGLAAAHALRSGNIRPIVLEAAARPGGVIDSAAENGFLAESGPISLMIASRKVEELIADLGLETSELVNASAAAKKRFIVKDRRLIALPSSPIDLFTTTVFSAKAKARALLEPFLPKRCATSNRAGMAGGGGTACGGTSGNGAACAGIDDRPSTDESVADFVRRRFGDEPLRYLVDPFISGIYAGDPEQLSMRHAFPTVDAMERESGSVVRGMFKSLKNRKRGTGSVKRRIVSFRSGMKSLPAAIATRLGDDFLSSCRVTMIESRDPGWIVRGERNGVAMEWQADGIVCALPSHALLKIDFKMKIPGDGIATLAKIPYAPVRTVTLGFHRNDVAHPLDGFGYLAPSSENLRHLGTLFTSTLFPGRAPSDCVTVTSFIGGSRRPEAGRGTLDSVLPGLLEEYRELLGVSGEPVFVKSFQHDRAIPQMELGYDRFLSACAAIESANPGFLFAGTWRDGISVPNAIESGAAVAQRMSESIGRHITSVSSPNAARHGESGESSSAMSGTLHGR